MDLVDVPSTVFVLLRNPSAIDVAKNAAGHFAAELVGIPLSGIETEEIFAL